MERDQLRKVMSGRDSPLPAGSGSPGTSSRRGGPASSAAQPQQHGGGGGRGGASTGARPREKRAPPPGAGGASRRVGYTGVPRRGSHHQHGRYGHGGHHGADQPLHAVPLTRFQRLRAKYRLVVLPGTRSAHAALATPPAWA